MLQPPNPKQKDLTFFRNLTLSASLLVFFLMINGGIVRVTQSGSACQDWPTCLGSWSAPSGNQSLIDYTHRLITFLIAPVLLSAAFFAWRKLRHEKWILIPVSISSAVLVAQVALGGVMALSGGNPLPGDSAIHLLLSLLLQAGVLLSLVSTYHRLENPGRGLQMVFRSPFSRLVLLVASLVLLTMVSGVFLSSRQAGADCTGWPLCGQEITSLGLDAWIHLIHRGIVALTSLGLAALLIKAWKTQRSQTAILVSATGTTILFFAQALLGAKLTNGFPTYLLGLHQATAAAAFSGLVVLIAVVGLAQRTSEQESEEASAIQNRKGLAKDLLLLTKPIVVALLLVTTYAGMVIGAQAWPTFSLTFWTLLGGFMAAGGSGAVNQYIDRYDDGKMQRTQRRPIPAGRITESEGLAFGVALLLASFYILTAFVNLLAALLSLAGMIYYVLLYSIYLKKTTVKNIVIGGGAGAIPPLVGWAAATGSLNFPALLLFAVIFMWTPPHFWALALVRKNDYARAGVPMLPVVRGEKETRYQILLYTIELVVLTLLLPLLGLGGAIYLLGAGILGSWLFILAWKVWKQGGNKLAWKMYRYSSMYLAFLFFVLMIDRLV